MTRQPKAAKLSGAVLQPARPYQKSPSTSSAPTSGLNGTGSKISASSAVAKAGVKHDPTVPVVSHVMKGGFPDAGLLMKPNAASKGQRLHSGRHAGAVPSSYGNQNTGNGGFPKKPSLLNAGAHRKEFDAGKSGYGLLPKKGF